ncbi:MAG: TetR/AcrR family transcriptional regulator [Bacteroidota bacterium]
MKPSTQRKKEQAKQLKRLHILDCAENIMTREGLNGLSMDALAKEAEIAKGTLYLYFKSKEDVIAKLSVRARENLLKSFIQETSKFDDPLDQIRSILWSNFYFPAKNRLHSDLMSIYEVSRDLEEPEELLQAGHQIQSFILALLERARTKGAIKPTTDIATFSLTMWGTSVGITHLIDTRYPLIKEYTGHSQKEFFNHYVELMIDGIKA